MNVKQRNLIRQYLKILYQVNEHNVPRDLDTYIVGWNVNVSVIIDEERQKLANTPSRFNHSSVTDKFDDTIESLTDAQSSAEKLINIFENTNTVTFELIKKDLQSLIRSLNQAITI